MNLLIDGYNFLGRFPNTARSLEDQRKKLAATFSPYKTSHSFTLVFDGTRSGNVSMGREVLNGIRCVYSAHGETADQLLIAMAKKHRERVVIVSSDREVLNGAKQAGSGILTCEEFWGKLRQASDEIPMKDDDRPQHKRWATYKKGPAKRLTKAKRKAMKHLDKL